MYSFSLLRRRMFSLGQRIAKVLTMIKQDAMVVYLPNVNKRMTRAIKRAKVNIFKECRNEHIYQPKQPKGNVPPESHA